MGHLRSTRQLAVIESANNGQFSQKRRFLGGSRRGERIAAERAESASQKSFLVPSSEKRSQSSEFRAVQKSTHSQGPQTTDSAGRNQAHNSNRSAAARAIRRFD
jgi:hypothetical protein